MDKWIAVACGGAFGSVCRYGVGVWLMGRPVATLVVNVVGCLMMGALLHESLGGNSRWSVLAHPGVTVGLLGGLTTFSTFGYQSIQLAESGQWTACAINILANVVLGLAAVALGMVLAKAIFTGA